MNVCSFSFLISILVLSSAIFFLPCGLPRQFLRAVCNAVFLSLVIPNLASWIVLAIFLLSGFAVAAGLRRVKTPNGRTLFLGGYFTILLISFLVLKEYRFLGPLVPPGSVSRWVSIVGLSYMLFRQIHFIIQSTPDDAQSPSLWAYMNYQLDLFTLYAGPIQRFKEFQTDWDSTRPVLNDAHDRRIAYARILWGMIKVSYIGAMLLELTTRVSAKPLYINQSKDVLKFVTLFYAYPAFVYFNFSGYCDIVVAGSALIGARLPENFNRPYLARNNIDFWARWHMTLTHWIRDYVFAPLYKVSVERWPQHAKQSIYFCFFLSLLLAGVWHGSSWNFVIFGLLHGAGVSIAKAWEEMIIRHRKRAGLREYLKSRWIRVIATVITINFVCFTFLFFPPDLQGRVHFLRVFVAGNSAATGLSSVDQSTVK
jgi:D-alanyl-lipoteichoic acid acyltransferase DltB (MBOAT superfamily)